MPSKPRVFVGSSVEGLSIAEHLQLGLDYHAECTLWSQGVFGLSGGTLESLMKAVKEFDFAVLVLTPDDLVQKRSASKNSPRDNVLFELGLFMGALGRERTYIVYCRDVSIDLPTDLAGVTAATFAKRTDSNLQAALGPVCTRVKTAMEAAHQAHQHATSTPNDEAAPKLLAELSLLRVEFAEQRDSVRRLLESIMSGIRKPDSTKGTFRFFEGIWRDVQKGSTYYVRYGDDGKVRCVYCHGGNDELSGEYYDLKLIDKTIIARYRWFDREHISGYAYLRIETADRLAGGWWPSEAIDIDLVERLHKVGGGNLMVWQRQPASVVIPDWAEKAFQRLQSDRKT